MVVSKIKNCIKKVVIIEGVCVNVCLFCGLTLFN